jgi:hypothetical protein
MGRMRRDVLLLLLLSLVIRLLGAALIGQPGYMDVAYYAAGAIRIAEGAGLSEPFLWNYLDDPAGIPHVGFLYWMPLPSLLSAPFALLAPGSFLALQLPFALLSALLPSLAYVIGWRATDRRHVAWLAGLLTLFSGFFFPYWTLPETFTPFALLGTLALWLAGSRAPTLPRAAIGRWLLSGAVVGLAHLTRADGVLLLPVVALAPLALPRESAERRTARCVISHLAAVVLGYVLVMAPWFLRNLARIGTPLPVTGSGTLWLRTYDDIFCYRCDLSPSSYLAWGWSNILRTKAWALGVNLERFLAEDCLIFLLPFTLLGLYRLRRRGPFALALACLILFYLAHSLAFTFPGPRGGFFHASAALLPILSAAAADGLEAAIRWAARRRAWHLRQAMTVFSLTAVAAALALSGYAMAGKLTQWNHTAAAYEQVDAWLDRETVETGTVMVGNPPGFWYHTRRPAIAVPNEDVETLVDVARRYNVSHVVLDEDRPLPLAGLYAGEVTSPWLERAASYGQISIYRVLWQARPEFTGND